MKILQTLIPVIVNSNAKVTHSDGIILIKLLISIFIVINVAYYINGLFLLLKVSKERKFYKIDPSYTFYEHWTNKMNNTFISVLAKGSRIIAIFLIAIYYVFKLL